MKGQDIFQKNNVILRLHSIAGRIRKERPWEVRVGKS